MELQRFTVVIDHEALMSLLTYKKSTSLIARWRLRLLEYDFDIKYRRGVKHQATNTLSYLETNEHDTVEIDDDLHDDLTIGAKTDDNSTLDLNDAYEDSSSISGHRH